jgi:type VI secretion system protein ImpG
MIDRLFSLYEEELGFIREEAVQFGGQFGKVAARLRLSPTTGESTDPHVTRLIDSFALLAARLRLKLDDEFPEICQSLIASLYPQYLSPVPSCAIVQYNLDRVGASLADGAKIPRFGQLETQEVFGDLCKYRTCFQVHVPPVVIKKSEYLKPPFTFKSEPTWSNRIEAAISIELSAASDKFEWDKSRLDSLQLFLGGSSNCGNRLYEAILRDALGIGLFSNRCPDGIFVGADQIAATGFETNQGILDQDARTHPAYRILWEFFALPEKFRFINVNLREVWSKLASDNLRIVIYLSKFQANLAKTMSHEAIQVGCCPVANLFPWSADPVNLNETQVEYRVVPSSRWAIGMEVHSIQSVTASRPETDSDIEFMPFFRPAHKLDNKDQGRYWHLSRRRRMQSEAATDRGTEVYLTLVDLNFRPHPSDKWTLHVNTLCCNRDLVNDLGVHTALTHSGPPVTLNFVTSPTPTIRPMDRRDRGDNAGGSDWLWRLVSHLSLNHLSIAEDSSGELLREILSLYNCQDKEEIRKAINGVLKVRYKRGTAKVAGSNKGPGICRGIDIELEVDEELLESIGAYLFSAVLDRFFATYASINSWTRLKVIGRREQLIYQGPVRSGTKVIV